LTASTDDDDEIDDFNVRWKTTSLV